MDLQYDHIAEEALRDNAQASSSSSADDKKPQQPQQPQHTLNEDLQEAYKAITTSAWGSTLGGFFGNVVKQVRR